MCAHLFSTFATTFLFFSLCRRVYMQHRCACAPTSFQPLQPPFFFSPFVEECTCRGLELEESGSRHETMNHVKRTGDEMQIRVADNDISIESHHRNSHMV